MAPSPAPAPRSIGSPRAGVERPLVEADVEHRRVVVEDGLGAVAVVGVPVEDRHPGRRAAAGVGRGDGRVVDQAEPHRPRPLGVVPGRAAAAEGALDLAVDHGVDGRQSGAGCQRGGPEADVVDGRVGVEVAAPGRRQPLDGGQVGGVVHLLEVAPRRLLGRLDRRPGGRHRPLDGGVSGGPFRVAVDPGRDPRTGGACNSASGEFVTPPIGVTIRKIRWYSPEKWAKLTAP